MQERNRNWQFDFLKGISCVFVVFLHCRFPGVIGDLIIYAFRFPVPIFFMITGYYSYGKDRTWIFKRALGILKMLLLAELLYGGWYMAVALLDNGSLSLYLSTLEGFRHPFRTILCGTVFNPTLWYLYAAFWTYVILFFLNAARRKRWSYVLIPVLLWGQIFGRFYWQNHYDINQAIYWFRSAYLFGLPMTLLGSLLAENEQWIKEMFSLPQAFLITVFGGGIMVVEYFVSGQYMDFHLSTIFVSVGLFMMAMTFPAEKPGGVFSVVSYIGRRLSMWIYLLHMWCSSVLERMIAKIAGEYEGIYVWLKPILVCLSACLLAFAISGIQEKLRNRRQVSTAPDKSLTDRGL